MHYFTFGRVKRGQDVSDFKRIRLGVLNPLSANPTKWSNTFKQFLGNLPTDCFSVVDHFVGLALKRLRFILKVKLKLPVNAISVL